jgi:hypothetical protein
VLSPVSPRGQLGQKDARRIPFRILQSLSVRRISLDYDTHTSSRLSDVGEEIHTLQRSE